MSQLHVKTQMNAAKELASQLVDQAKSEVRQQAKRIHSEATGQAKKIQEAVTEDIIAGKNGVVNYVFDRAIGLSETQLDRLKNLKSKLLS